VAGQPVEPTGSSRKERIAPPHSYATVSKCIRCVNSVGGIRSTLERPRGLPNRSGALCAGRHLALSTDRAARSGWQKHSSASRGHRPRCRGLTRKRSTPAIRRRNEPARRAGLDSAGGKAFSIGITRCCCRGSASAMAPAGAFGFGRLGSRTPAGGGQLPRLPKRPKPRPPEPPERRPPTWSMAHLSGAVSAIMTGLAMITRARLRPRQPALDRRDNLPSPRPARAWPVTGGPRRAVRRRTPRCRTSRDSTPAERIGNRGRLSRRR
jgi:hypothetical protein